ncbi:LpxI family protein [Methylovirgula sp. 4M-Z18]|uniref:LpxI family protein n=1 Tax=Methylovirgula sp. 4M-Z18 TaxID=2293567 RepID=UPI000E2EC309|nr:UDP-2,3-diacylglucosamine diphosphatase LpxI [Methylovirgula sp. 4M-Z18]RFB80223.1 DUF1009 domain-containing protein [Methylovirgula sp. 4M-Z18]
MSGAGQPVAIICGNGRFPQAVAEAAQRAGREVFLIGLKGAAEEAISAFPHMWVRVGELGKVFRSLKDRGIVELAFIGGLVRPDLSDLRPDFGALARLPDIARLLLGGDDHALSGLIKLFESEGHRVVGVHELAPELLVASGRITRTAASAEALADLDFGAQCLRALSPFDVGQGLIVAKQRIVAIEAAEGTDLMLRRIAELKRIGRLRAKGTSGVLIKMPKAGQDLRVDLPAVGPETIAACIEAQLSGLFLAAGQVLMLDRAGLAAQADAAGLFVHGFEATA